MTLVLATESNPGSATWINASALGSSFWGFPVLTEQQLSDSQQAILQGITIVLDQGPQVGSTISIRSTLGGSTVTETWTVVSGAPTANFQTQYAADAGQFYKDWAENLAFAVANYGGRYLLGQPASMFSALVAPATLYRAVQGVESYDDRVFGTVNAECNFRVVDYSLAGAGAYAYTGLTTLPSTDPGYKTFGPGKTILYASEIHVDLSDDQYSVRVWDAGNITWATWTNLLP